MERRDSLFPWARAKALFQTLFVIGCLRTRQLLRPESPSQQSRDRVLTMGFFGARLWR
jgi:hypothetical protein